MDLASQGMASSTRHRLRFAKNGNLRLISHNDLMRCFERAIRRAGLPVASSQGFNPRPKMSFAMALALGIEGTREVVDLELTTPLESDDLLRELSSVAPQGLEFLEAVGIPPGKPPRVVSAAYRIPLPSDRVQEAQEALDQFLAATMRLHERRRPDRTTEFDLRPFVLSAQITDQGELHFRLLMDPSGSARPEEILESLGLRDLLHGGAILVRTDLELAS